MSRVKIEDLDPEARELDLQEMKSLFGGLGSGAALSSQTAQVCFVGLYGKNEADKVFIEGTAAAGVDTSFLKIDGANKLATQK